jgi:tRNA threonylcarbamoyladenosine biosynthesis protein TsaB
VTAGGLLLAMDTATTHAVIALGGPDGTMVQQRSWAAGYRHGEELLARIEALLGDAAVSAGDLGGLVAGTGPGAFTGLRVGLATVKGLAYGLGLPVVGVPTGEALLAAAAAGRLVPPGPEDGERVDGEARPALVLLQPAGPSDRVLTRPGRGSRIVPGGDDPDLLPGERLVAVDLEGREAPDATALGDAALAGLAAALLRAGAARLAAGDADDLAGLVPEYVTLPRGVLSAVPDATVEVTGSGSDR